MLIRHLFTFPSPRGDKLQRLMRKMSSCPRAFPSPRGDKLQPGALRGRSKKGWSFRPLAGISCNNGLYTVLAKGAKFPSPRGDKLQR